MQGINVKQLFIFNPPLSPVYLDKIFMQQQQIPLYPNVWQLVLSKLDGLETNMNNSLSSLNNKIEIIRDQIEQANNKIESVRLELKHTINNLENEMNNNISHEMKTIHQNHDACCYQSSQWEEG